MFPARFYPARMFAARYFPKVGAEAAAPAATGHLFFQLTDGPDEGKVLTLFV